MDERIPPAAYFRYSPSGIHSSPSPHHSMRSPAASSDRERYLAELLAERHKLGPFVQVLPFCNRLLNQEIARASDLAASLPFFDPEKTDHGSPLRLSDHPSNGGPMDLEDWPGMHTEEYGFFHRIGVLPNWDGTSGVTGSPVVKKVVRLDIPIDRYPNYNFVGRLLGPRGNSLKRVEATTQCRVYIRGRGSVKDSIKDESMDYYKKQQLRELAILNGTLREESPQMSPGASPFNTTGMKQAKTGR